MHDFKKKTVRCIHISHMNSQNTQFLKAQKIFKLTYNTDLLKVLQFILV